MAANRPPVQAIQASEVISTLDIDEPDILRTLYSRKGDQWKNEFVRIIQMCGFSFPADQEVYYHYEDDDYHRSIEVAGGITGTGASHANFTVTLAATDVFMDSISGLHIFPRVGDILTLPNNGTGTGVDRQALVTSVNAAGPSLTAKLLESPSYTVPDLVAGDKIIITSGAAAEGTGQPKGTVRNVRKYSNQLQIIKETWEGTGTEMTNGKWIRQTSEGKDITSYYLYGQEQVDYELALKMDGALMFGRPAAASAVVDPSPEATGRFVRTTKGMVPEIKDRGTTITYPIGAFDITRFNEAAQVAENERAGRTMAIFYSFPLGVELEDLLVDYLDNTDISYAFEGSGANSKKMVSIGFKGIQKAETVFLFKKLGTLSNTTTYAEVGYEDYNNMAIVCPLRMDQAYKADDSKTIMDVPTFGMRYKKQGSYSRLTQVWEIDGTGHKASQRMLIPQDVAYLYTRAHVGFHGTAFNQMQLWQGE